MSIQQAVTMWRESASLIMLSKDKMLSKGKAFDYHALLFIRAQNASFMPNSSVFPGGVCEPADQSPLWLKYFQRFGVPKENLMDLCGSSLKHKSTIYSNDEESVLDKSISLRITAIRETFEEVGVMLCCKKNQIADLNAFGQFKEDFDRTHWQKIIHNDASKFLTLCEELEVVPDLWRLHEWSSWLTPATFKKRFRTAFYLVALEKTPDLIVDKTEAMECSWKTPMDYIKSYISEEIWLPPPQFYELSRLLNFSELDKLLEFAKERSVHGTTLILPVQYKCSDGTVSLLPGDDLYPTDPNSTSDFIDTGLTMEEFRSKATKLHRSEYVNLNKAVVYLNFPLLDGQLAPINVNSKAKL